MERAKPALQKEKIAKHRPEIRELLQIKNRVNVFGSFLPNLVNYLQMLCHTFKAGQVAAHIAAWRTLTNDKVLLSDILGAAIEQLVELGILSGPFHRKLEYSVV